MEAEQITHEGAITHLEYMAALAGSFGLAAEDVVALRHAIECVKAWEAAKKNWQLLAVSTHCEYCRTR